ncbi:hypothetical protein [Microlunatus soli]|uniref:Uncharacterized protein n=1 Tax=Microlunatus soli TaxID=630515 RepID=A0A1H1V4J0_9ACTN|nr:hypothetical protein [Microlunatus soli]SDS79401.1 hypothetical protein SAMN04489812_3054 [Microlunatus soli]
MFIRFQSPVPGKRGVHTGVFGLMNGLGRSGLLTDAEHRIWRRGNDWFNAAYPDPSAADPDVYSETVNPQATAWFKDTAVHLLARVPPYLEILRSHQVPCLRVESDDPGSVIYEDGVQIVVNPRPAMAYLPR